MSGENGCARDSEEIEEEGLTRRDVMRGQVCYSCHISNQF